MRSIRFTKKILTFTSVGTLATASMLLGVFMNSRTSDASVAGWDAGYIISDSVFTNKNTMSAGSIQAFLNSKVPHCDTWGTQPSEFGGGTRRQWAEARGYSPPYTCLKDYRQGGKSAAQIIYEAAQTYNINPQVLLVLLQKEQSLVTDTWPLSIQYRSATGYGCPDSAACDADYYGFTNQVKWAATMFRAIMNDSPTWYTPYELGNNYIRYNPVASCGGSTVNIRNRATQALYNYTPYQPNQGALNAGWGTAHCGSYGNRNFYLYFTSWFGATKTKPTYRWSFVSQGLYADAARTQKLPYNAILEPGQKVYMRVTAKNTGNQTWRKANTRLATSNPRDRSSAFRNSDWLTRNRAASITQSEVKPGETATFDTSFTAPQRTGTYKEYFRPVVDGVAWMNDLGLYFPIRVDHSRKVAIYLDSSRKNHEGSGRFTAFHGEKYYGKLTIRNTTATTMPAGTRLATTNPQDRLSDFRDSSWISENRVAQLTSSIPPGGTGTILFTLQAPSTPGSYTESFGLVVDSTGGGWIEDDTATFTINVTERPADKLADGTVRTLRAGEQLRSYNDMYRLILQGDGNLVLYDRSRGKPLWASNTVRSGANRLVLQGDGNLVLYRGGKPFWASNTVRKNSDRLVMQNDGNLVLYAGRKPVWASGTDRR